MPKFIICDLLTVSDQDEKDRILESRNPKLPYCIMFTRSKQAKKERRLLDIHPLLPLYPLFRDRQGKDADQGGPGACPELCQQLGRGALGTGGGEDHGGLGAGSPDGRAGVRAAGVDPAAYRRRRRSGGELLLGHPGLGRGDDLPERGPRADADLLRDLPDHEPPLR